MSQMLTVSQASAFLLVCLGIGVLVILCCAALIWARTHFAPHVDCAKQLSAFSGMLEDVLQRQKTLIKKKSGEAGGRPVAPKPKPELDEELPVAEARLSDIDLEKAANERMLKMINGRS